MEKVMEEISFDAPSRAGQTVVIDRGYVEQRLVGVSEDLDLSRYIL
jgi:ATP-dependent HslUV protease ATP-binding subunit HslU